MRLDLPAALRNTRVLTKLFHKELITLYENTQKTFFENEKIFYLPLVTAASIGCIDTQPMQTETGDII
jgi:hypothetical protein